MRKILLTAFVALTSITSCCSHIESSASSIKESSSKSIQDLYAKNLIEWNSILTQNYHEYYSYIFSPTCYYCNKVKNEINLLANYSEIPFFFIEFNENIPTKRGQLDVIGCSNIDELYICGTPTLFVIKESSVINCYLGYMEIKEYISLVLDID